MGVGPHVRVKAKRGPKADVPVQLALEERRDRERIAFEIKAGMSNDERAFFESDVDVENGEELNWGQVEVAETISGLEIGRVVEVRR